jgi:hypothetical protein
MSGVDVAPAGHGDEETCGAGAAPEAGRGRLERREAVGDSATYTCFRGSNGGAGADGSDGGDPGTAGFASGGAIFSSGTPALSTSRFTTDSAVGGKGPAGASGGNGGAGGAGSAGGFDHTTFFICTGCSAALTGSGGDGGNSGNGGSGASGGDGASGTGGAITVLGAVSLGGSGSSYTGDHAYGGAEGAAGAGGTGGSVGAGGAGTPAGITGTAGTAGGPGETGAPGVGLATNLNGKSTSIDALSFTQQPPATADTSFGVKVSVEGTAGVVTSDQSTHVTLGLVSGSGTPGASLTCNSNPVTVTTGVATFSCSVDEQGLGYALLATATSLAPAVSSPFDVTVTQVTPTITWPTPTPIIFGSPLGGSQLDATASATGVTVTGTFTYTPPVGTVLQPGTHTLRVTFTPSTTSKFTSASKIVKIVVGFTKPCIASTVTGKFAIGTGQAFCLTSGGTFTGKVTVAKGGALFVTGGTITAPFTAKGAAAVTICGATITAPITVTGTTGPVVLGGTGCAGNHFTAPVHVTTNKGGVSFVNNKATAPVTITHNKTPFTFSGNTFTAPTTVKTN